MNPARRNILKLLPALVLASLGEAFAVESGRTLIRVNIPGPRSLPFLPVELIPILGLDQAMNVQLLIRYFPSGVRALEDMLTGNAQFSAQGFTVLHAFHSKGKNVRAIAPLSGQLPPYAIVVRSDLRRQIKTVADLKGRSIGASIGNVTSKTYSQQVAEALLTAYGVHTHEVRWVPTAQSWDGQFGALSSHSVDAVYCEEPFLSGLVRKKIGYVLSDFSDPKVRDKIPGAGHMRATLTTTAENLQQDTRSAEMMVQMLRQSLVWIFNTDVGEIVKRLEIKDQDEKLDLINVLSRSRAMYPDDIRFSQQQIEATSLFMRNTGILTDDSFDINMLIASQIAGVRP
jgi:NitT/TauT family transport system substrate-binding protein